MELVKIYDKSISGALQRKLTEAKLFRQGYRVLRVEEVKQFSAGKGCLLMIIFLPLVLFGGSKKIKVTYIKD